jgi:lysophospholipase L1-like esterase
MQRTPSIGTIDKAVTGRKRRENARLAPGPAVLALLAVGAITMAGAAQASLFDDDNDHWVGTWSNALHEPDLGAPGLANTGFNHQTLRQIVHISVGGSRVRVRLSTFGAGALVVGSAHLALKGLAAGSIASGSDRVLTFGSAPSITIPPGALVVSDPVQLSVTRFSDLVISIFLPGNTGPATWHFEGLQTAFISPPGDFTASSVMPVGATTTARFWLAGVDVAGSERRAIVALGDSITDGTQSTVDASARWTDDLAHRLAAEFGNSAMGVLNEGIAGGRLLHDSLGPNALARFDRDVLAQTGVSYVIVQLGGNDIFTVNPDEEVTVEQLVQGHRELIQRAHAKGLKIFGCTLTPVKGFLVPGTSIPVYSDAKEGKRQALNMWIRGSREYDGVIDFDRVLRDPHAPFMNSILPSLDSGDHGHPLDPGYQALANAIDLKLFASGQGQQ